MLGQKLRHLRISAGLTQRQLGKKLGVSPSTIGMYEQDRRNPDNTMLSKICKTLHASGDYLLGIDKIGDAYSKNDLIDVFDGFLNFLKTNKKLMLNGEILSDKKKKEISSTLKIATEIALKEAKK